MTAEIIDYNYDRTGISLSLNASFYFAGIEKIRFRSIDTAGLLKSVVLKKALPKQAEVPKNKTTQKQPVEHMVYKTMKVPFSRINFLYGSASFLLFIEEINQELTFEIENADIRPEFDAIREYFIKALKKKLIVVDITVRYTESSIISATAKSEDISNINDSLIESVRFQFVRKEIFRPKAGVAFADIRTGWN